MGIRDWFKKKEIEQEEKPQPKVELPELNKEELFEETLSALAEDDVELKEPKSVEVTPEYDSDVRSKPIFKEFANEIVEMMNGAIIVGHNARKFDMPLLENEFYRCGVSPPKPKVILDTLEHCRRIRF